MINSNEGREYHLGDFIAEMVTQKEKHENFTQDSLLYFFASQISGSKYSSLKQRLSFKNMKIKGYLENDSSLSIKKQQACGVLLHCFDEIWFFLLNANYVRLVGRPLQLSQENSQKKKIISQTLMKMEVYLLQKSIEDDFQIKIMNYNKEGSNETIQRNLDSFDYEMAKYSRLSLLLLFELMGQLKQRECKVNTLRQFNIYFKTIDSARLTKQILDPYRNFIHLTTNDFRKFKYYMESVKQVSSNQGQDQLKVRTVHSYIFKILRNFKANILFQTSHDKFITYEQTAAIIATEQNPVNLVKMISQAKTTSLSLTLAPISSHPLYNVTVKNNIKMIQKWQNRHRQSLHGDLNDQFQILVMLMEENFYNYNTFQRTLKMLGFSDRQMIYIWELYNKQTRLNALKNQTYSKVELTKEEQSDQCDEVNEQEDTQDVNQFLNAMNKDNLRLRATPIDLKSELKAHQKQALSWMHFREGRISEEEAFTVVTDKQVAESLSPLWVKYKMFNDEVIYCNSFTGKLQMHAEPMKPTKGGILADEMGLGKTVMALALIIESKQLEPKLGLCGTLIVVPKSVICQWGKEINLHCQENALTFYSYYELSSRKNTIDLHEFDVILTTYAVLGLDYADKFGSVKQQMDIQNEREQKEFEKLIGSLNGGENIVASSGFNRTRSVTVEKVEKKKEKKEKKNQRQRAVNQLNLFDFEFQRVILDEAHNIKGQGTNQSQGAFALKTSYRWCMTGTPMQNKHDDLFSLVSFLQVETFGEYFWWNQYINKEENEDDQQQMLAEILQPILLRRTKNSDIFDNQTKEEIIYVDLTDKERLVYSKLREGSSLLFKHLVNRNEANKQYIHIFQIIGKLRMACDHPQLALKDIKSNKPNDIMERVEVFLQNQIQKTNQLTDRFKEEVLADIRKGTIKECIICFDDDIISFSLAPCGHLFCTKCFKSAILKQGKCPNCRMPLLEKDLLTCDRDVDNIKSEIFQCEEAISSKLSAILTEVQEIKKKGEKCLIFSQWIDMINLIGSTLSEHNIYHEVITGSQTILQREKRIRTFKDSDHSTALLLSIKASSTGLNLTMANNVLIVDPWWNVNSCDLKKKQPAIEDQAIGRADRIGQEKQVTVKRFICKRTIEQRINELHQRKRQMINRAMKNTPNKKNNDIEDIKYLLDCD